MTEQITFTEYEIKALAQDDRVLDALAEWHSNQETMAEAADYIESAHHHEKRRKALQVKAEELRAKQLEWQS